MSLMNEKETDNTPQDAPESPRRRRFMIAAALATTAAAIPSALLMLRGNKDDTSPDEKAALYKQTYKDNIDAIANLALGFGHRAADHCELELTREQQATANEKPASISGQQQRAAKNIDKITQVQDLTTAVIMQYATHAALDESPQLYRRVYQARHQLQELYDRGYVIMGDKLPNDRPPTQNTQAVHYSAKVLGTCAPGQTGTTLETNHQSQCPDIVMIDDDNKDYVIFRVLDKIHHDLIVDKADSSRIGHYFRYLEDVEIHTHRIDPLFKNRYVTYDGTSIDSYFPDPPCTPEIVAHND